MSRGARQFSLSTFCLWISRYVAESARKLVKYANCPGNSVKIEFFVYPSNRILSHDASTFARRSSKGFVAILADMKNIISLILTLEAWNLYLYKWKCKKQESVCNTVKNTNFWKIASLKIQMYKISDERLQIVFWLFHC